MIADDRLRNVGGIRENGAQKRGTVADCQGRNTSLSTSGDDSGMVVSSGFGWVLSGAAGDAGRGL